MGEDNKKVAWNASQGIIMEISNRRSMANTHFISGDVRKSMNSLIAIKQSVIQSFNAAERQSLKDIEDRFHKVSHVLYRSVSGSFNPNMREAYGIAKKLALKVYSVYNDRLMDLLEKYGYLIGEQSDASMMKF